MLSYPRGKTVSSQWENIVCVHGVRIQLGGLYDCCPMGAQIGAELLLVLLSNRGGTICVHLCPREKK